MAGNPGIQILLTRPHAQSVQYGAELQRVFGANVHIIRSPLTKIVTTVGFADLSNITTLLFSSGNGVRAFCDRSQRRDIPCLCVGDKTADTAREMGFQAVSAMGSSDDLLALAIKWSVGDKPRFLHVRGQHATGNILKRLKAAGLTADEFIAYDQIQQPLTDQARTTLIDDGRLIAPLFSPRTAQILCQACKGLKLRNVVFVCISQNVADILLTAGFGEIRTAKHPTASDVTREIAALV